MLIIEDYCQFIQIGQQDDSRRRYCSPRTEENNHASPWDRSD